MSSRTIVTALVENTVNIRGLSAEHGLAFLVRSAAGKLLFDTGQTDLLLRNARHMGLPLADLYAVALSHGHNDHTGGLPQLLSAAHQARVFLHPSAVEPKFARNSDGTSRSIGMPQPSRTALETALANRAGSVVWNRKPLEVIEGIWLTGEIPRRNSFEDDGGSFFQDEACTRPDALPDDQALFFDTSKGTVIVLGCAHAGVVNTLEYVAELTHDKPVRTIVGGMHLLNASRERMERTLEALRKWHVGRLVPAHCTGIHAWVKLCTAFPDRCAPCPVGTSIDFS